MRAPQTAHQLSGTRDLAGESLTSEVLAQFEGVSSPRLRDIVQSLVRHLHAFAREENLTEAEWWAGIQFLTRTGQFCNASRQEFVLLSDVLGLSELVNGLTHPATGNATESTVLGPFYVDAAPALRNGDNLAPGAPGDPCLVRGQVLSTDGGPVRAARLDIWQADGEGLYDVQRPELAGAQARGSINADPDGRFWFWTVKPSSYPVPTDGPVGDLLRAAHRSAIRPAHVHFRVSAPGYQALTTHVFDSADPYLDTDAVFAVKDSLVADFVRNAPGVAADGASMDTAYYTLTKDLVLEPG